MELKATANWRISLAPSAGARWEKSPLPNCWAVASKYFTGANSFRESIETRRVPKATAARPVQIKDRLTAETRLAATGSATPWALASATGSLMTANEPTCIGSWLVPTSRQLKV